MQFGTFLDWIVVACLVMVVVKFVRVFLIPWFQKWREGEEK